MPSRMSDEGQPQRTLQPPKPGICERAQGHQLASNGVGAIVMIMLIMAEITMVTLPIMMMLMAIITMMVMMMMME